MILGYDEAVRYPVKDLYDTGMMNLYIGAIKDEYERGIKEQEDFISKYGDFISPFKKDVETWDRLTIDPIVQAYDEMQAHGIDPLRSQEGRTLLASIRRRVPRETLSQLRQSAAAGQEYLKNRAKLQAEGAYNPDFENFLLNGASFEDWDTTQGGMWDRTSPVEYKGLRTLTDPWFKNRTKKFDAELTKKRNDGYLWYTYTADDMKQAANDQIQAFLGSDYGRYFYDRALQRARQSAVPGESEAAIRSRANNILIDDIVAANGDYLIEVPEVNPYAMADYKFRQDVALEGIKHRNRMKEAQEEADNFAALMPAGPQSLNQGDVATQQGDSAANLEREVVNAKLRYYGGWLQKNKSKKGSKDYNKIQSLYNWWKDAGTNAGRKKLYKVDSEGRWMPTSRFKAAVDNYNKTYVKYHKLTPGQVTTRYMNNNTVHYTGPQAEIIRNWFGGETEQIPNTDLKYKTINFGDAGTQLTKVRTTSLSGAPLTRGSISVAFNKYLKDNRVKGYIIPGDVRTGRSVNRSGRGNYTDVYYTALIPESAFNNFKEKQKSLGKIVDEGKLEKALGVVRMNLGSYKTPGGAIAEKIVYAVPVSTSIQDRYMSTYNDELNDKSLYGQSKTWTTATENRQPLAGYRINWQ